MISADADRIADARDQDRSLSGQSLADNLGIRLCLAAVMVMPSALVFLLPVLSLLGAPDDAMLPMAGADAAFGAALARARVGFAAAWMRIVFPANACAPPGAAPLRHGGPRARHVALGSS